MGHPSGASRTDRVRAICLVRLDKTRPAVVLTRAAARGARTKVTVAPITSTIKGLSSEVLVGPANGLDHDCAISLDNVLSRCPCSTDSTPRSRRQSRVPLSRSGPGPGLA